MSARYRLVFRGKYLPGLSPAEVAGNLAGLFQVPLARIDELLALQPAVIKHDVSLDEGNRYLEVLAEQGLVSHLENLEVASDAAPGGWDGIERRLGMRRQQGRDRRDSPRTGAIQPDRRMLPGRRKTD